jgi:alanine-alpha-ketoisovalerate/valine-pyruvate aminotransferase
MSNQVYVESIVECICGNDVWGMPGQRCQHCIAEMEFIELLDALDY